MSKKSAGRHLFPPLSKISHIGSAIVLFKISILWLKFGGFSLKRIALEENFLGIYFAIVLFIKGAFSSKKLSYIQILRDSSSCITF